MKLIWRWDDFVIFLENIASLSCLLWSGLNDIFRWYAHSDIFCKSLFNSFAEVLGSWTMENNDVSSANSFTVDVMSTDRSLMYIRKKSGPKMSPWGTPAFTGNRSNVWPFKTTLWNLFAKKLLISSSNASEIPIDLSLKISPSCHTISKALDISKKTSRDSRLGYASKTEYVL